MDASYPNIAEFDVIELTSAEEDFALALVEYGGNPGAAYKSLHPHDSCPGARGREILARQHVAMRVQQLNICVHQASLITVESHLIELAEIRDMAKAMGAVKVALDAEKSRGSVIGLYHEAKAANDAPKDDHLQRQADRLMKMRVGAVQVNVEDARVVG